MKNMDTKYLRIIWAKSDPFKSILSHALDTAAVANVLLTEGIFNTVLPDLAEWILKDRSPNAQKEIISLNIYLSSIHDIGKITPFFAGKNENLTIDPELQIEWFRKYYKDDIKYFRHEKYSKEVVMRIWQKKERFEFERRNNTVKNLAEILGEHHQRKKGEKGRTPEIPDSESKVLWRQQQEIFEDILYEQFHPPKVILNADTGNVSAACMLMLGIVILSDWLASSRAFASEELAENEDINNYYQKIQKRASILVKQSRLSETNLPKGWLFTDVWTNISREKMRSLQTTSERLMLKEEKPLLMIIEAPMGEGKTEAGAYAAFCMGKYYGKKGFYVALPTSATANQMHGRMENLVKQLFHNKEVRLLHSLAWLIDETTKEKQEFISEDKRYAQEWTTPLRRGLLEGYSVGTIDQVLMSALYVKYGVLRLLGMQNKVLILDEVHAYDAYMQDILLKMLMWCKSMKIPVVMLSATLATETKETILEVYDVNFQKEQEYPAITAVYQNGQYQVTQIPKVASEKDIVIHLKESMNDIEAICDLSLKTVQNGGCLCVLTNTVKKAQKLYSLIKEKKTEGTQLYLFHAAFSVKQKNKIEKKVVQLFGTDKSYRPQSAIVIATQVVEQSLDVDFDFMITDIAPIDLLLQRFGRVFRHKETLRPLGCNAAEVTVLIPKKGEEYQGTKYVYPPVLLNLTKQYLLEHNKISCPGSIRTAVEYVYGEQAVINADLEEWMKHLVEEDFKQSQAASYEIRKPNEEKFDIYDSDNIFDDLEKKSFFSAKTRLSKPTIRIAVVSDQLFQKVQSVEYISKELAKEVFLNSVSVREEIIKKYSEDFQNIDKIEGQGFLKYMLIFHGDNGIVQGDKNTKMILDDELGFFIQEGGTG